MIVPSAGQQMLKSMIIVTAVVGSDTGRFDYFLAVQSSGSRHRTSRRYLYKYHTVPVFGGLCGYNIGQGLSRYQRSGPLRQVLVPYSTAVLRLLEHSV